MLISFLGLPVPSAGATREGLKPIRVTLDNGLTVILQEVRSAPVVAFNIWVKVGSADESDAEAGLAHVLEHMIFKGTERRGVGQIAQEVEGAGGNINAFTSFDQTVYHIVLASRFFDVGLDIIADAIQNSSFDPDELEKELEVVIEEVKRGEDRPGRQVAQALFGESYRVHPYRRPVIGYADRIRGFSRPFILDFYRRWYAPENMSLVVAGDFDAREALPKIKKAFSTFSRPFPPPRERPAEPTQEGLRVTFLTDPVKEAHLELAFHIPALIHEDVYALDVLAIIAGQGESSRLYRDVKAEQELVYSVSASSFTPKNAGVFVAGATLEPAQTSMALRAILKTLYRFRHQPVSPTELEKAKTNVEADFVYRLETVQGQAQSLGSFETVAGDINFGQRYLHGVRAVTAEDVREVAERYLRGDNLTVAILLPEEEGGALDEATVRREAEAAETEAAEAREEISSDLSPVEATAGVIEEEVAPLAPTTDGVHREVLPNGLTLLVKENPSVPLVALRAVFLGGLRFEDERTNGINNFMADMLTQGTETRDAATLATLVESMAAGLGGFSGRNSFGVEAEGLSGSFERLLEIFSDVLLHPTFDPSEMEKSRRDILAAIKRQEDNLVQYAFQLFSETLYPEHPYGMPVIGTEKSVTALKREDLLDYYRRLVDPENLVLAVVGDVRRQDVLRLVQQYFGGMERRGFQPPQLPAVEAPSTVQRSVRHRDKQQAHLIIGFLGTTLDDPDRYPLEVLDAVLSNQGGRLFVELRDKQSLAYSLSGFSRLGLDPGVLGVYLGVSPEKVEQATTAALEELEKLRTSSISEEELSRAKRLLIGSFEIGLQENSAQAADMAFNERYGLGYDAFQRYAQHIESVTAEDVLRVARQYLPVDAYTIGMVKPDDGTYPEGR